MWASVFVFQRLVSLLRSMNLQKTPFEKTSTSVYHLTTKIISAVCVKITTGLKAMDFNCLLCKYSELRALERCVHLLKAEIRLRRLLYCFRVFFGVFLALLILSTSYEVSCNWRNCPKNPVLSSFSVYTNSKTIMTMKPLAKKEMLFLHGIRSLAIIWIVLGHTFSLGVWMSLSINQLDLAETFKNIFTMILFSGFFGVNTFFMLSSLLLTLSVFRELDAT